MWLHRDETPYDPDPASLHWQQTYDIGCDGGTGPKQAWIGIPEISGYPNTTEVTFPPFRANDWSRVAPVQVRAILSLCTTTPNRNRYL